MGGISGRDLRRRHPPPPHYRAVIYLYYYEGYQAAEIGAILGVPTATVHTRLVRGRARLRELLGGADYERSV